MLYQFGLKKEKTIMNDHSLLKISGLVCAAALMLSSVPLSASAGGAREEAPFYTSGDNIDTNDIPGNRHGVRHYIDVENMLQMPDLPTGCESVSLTIVLDHVGYPADKFDIVRNYLPKQEFYYIDDQLYGADFVTTFAGDPEDENSYGCYAPCMVTTANNYLSANKYKGKAYDLSGSDFEKLLSDYIEHDIPLMIWITNYGLEPSSLSTVWKTPEGKTVQWRRPEHCVVLIGYDREKNVVYTADPIYGLTAYDHDTLVQRFCEMGMQAVLVNSKPDLGTELPGDADMDGFITSNDALKILRSSVELEEFDSYRLDISDTDNDGVITSGDALIVLRESIM